ncbi:uncharacterized protein MONOS_2297 [Monocercomonoides exilis]|uniref:uncharacterized protein n=1 Tax=Monocercomonoides exilis TaxID=2049356 RepID=UPI00355A6C39|nr:hypothetical protein MONOS_2297 [Monocercomonoides exilis]|eukprot:MONOS_2297.1-p1 / transcript=MONOS_2297.1 / gene=MONOS_2297 / organism=Monocercomonoides_exilis_PA203 / gene_product=unspecified product / transcript_product=unspecified product / location=Mono_scaffold00046:178559-179356(-) / protein_length=266 / sequence_SO=supercontig / SO=protein_coding / is_pseudo=false
MKFVCEIIDHIEKTEIEIAKEDESESDGYYEELEYDMEEEEFESGECFSSNDEYYFENNSESFSDKDNVSTYHTRNTTGAKDEKNPAGNKEENDAEKEICNEDKMIRRERERSFAYEDDILCFGNFSSRKRILQCDSTIENEALEQTQKAVFDDWYPRLIVAFNEVTNIILQGMDDILISGCKALFRRSLLVQDDAVIEDDPYVYYEELALKGDMETVYSNFAFNLIASPCSEAFCERMFSKARRIVGDRRHSLSLISLNTLMRL